MKQKKSMLAILLLATMFTACQKNAEQGIKPGPDLLSSKAKNNGEADNEKLSTGHVYTLSNQMSGNKILDYKRAKDGQLVYAASVATGGTGTGGGLGNQGAIVFDNEGEYLLAVNSGSNTISSFKITENGLRLHSTVSSRGIMPISITQQGDLVFVLNAGGDGNIAGFFYEDGRLIAIPNAVRALSTTASGPAEISLLHGGRVVVVTEKATNKIISYTIDQRGRPGVFHSLTSANATPFGFANAGSGNIIVSEAAGGASGASTLSSYHITPSGEISLISGPKHDNQSAACWVVIAPRFRQAYTTNTGSNTVSSFAIDYSGGLTLNSAVAINTGDGPIDADFSRNSQFLYVLNSKSNSLSVFKTGDDGSLSNVQTVEGIPAGATGVAAR